MSSNNQHIITFVSIHCVIFLPRRYYIYMIWCPTQIGYHPILDSLLGKSQPQMFSIKIQQEIKRSKQGLIGRCRDLKLTRERGLGFAVLYTTHMHLLELSHVISLDLIQVIIWYRNTKYFDMLLEMDNFVTRQLHRCWFWGYYWITIAK